MAQRKTQQTTASVGAFIASIEDASRRKDCRAIAKLMAAATGEKPTMWGPSIIGFGKRHYHYANGKPAELCKVGFAPRARSFAFYLPSYPGHAALIKELGKHKYCGGCLHVAKLSDVDSKVLGRIVRDSFRSGGARAAKLGVAADVAAIKCSAAGGPASCASERWRARVLLALCHAAELGSWATSVPDGATPERER